jgi:lambda family phage portal protein
MARHFEAATNHPRADGWSRKLSDANSAASGATLAVLRAQARDDVRNNPWARRGLRRIKTNTVGWGIRPQANGRGAGRVMELWKKWAETTDCDAAGRLTFYGLQGLIMRTVVESGEVLIRRRMRLPKDGLAVPMQLQVLEPDYLDTAKDGIKGSEGGEIIQGVEFNAIGQRVAYWLFDRHPGGRGFLVPKSKRVPADGVLHVFEQERAGQVRGPSWFASIDVRLHEFDQYEDATLMKQKIAACLAAFVTDPQGDGGPLAEGGTSATTGQPTDSIEPGMIVNLPPGKDVKIANPPSASDHQSFSATSLRAIAAGLGTTYEDLTGDYSQVNYSSARMGRNAHMATFTTGAGTC